MKVLLLILTILMSFGSFAMTEIVLTNKNVVVMDQAFSWTNVAAVMSKAKELDSYLPEISNPIYVVLDTPGGDIEAGLEMFAFLNSLNRPVYTIVMFAASMGAQAVSQLGNSYILPYGTLMHHKAAGSFSGSFGGKGPGQLDNRYGFWLRRIKMMDKVTVAKSNGKLTLKKFQDLYENELWLTGIEAVNLGLINDVASVKCSKGLSGVEIITATRFGIVLKGKKSKCPTISGVFDITVEVATNKGIMNIDKFIQNGGKYPCKSVEIKKSSGFYDYEEKVIAKAPSLCSNIDPRKAFQERSKYIMEVSIKTNKVQRSY